MKTHHDDRHRGGARRIVVPLLALTLAGSVSCGEEGSTVDGTNIHTTQSPLFVNAGVTLWNGATSETDASFGTPATIGVCFAVKKRVKVDGTVDQFCPSQSQGTDCHGQTSGSVTVGNQVIPVAYDQNLLRPLVKKWILQTWAHAANIEFVNWGDCPVDAATGFHQDSQLTQTVVIQWTDTDNTFNDDEDPSLRLFRAGRSSKGPTVISYNWPWYSYVATHGLAGMTLFNLIHEFGHALGFAHEWERPGYVFPAGCSQDEDPVNEPLGMETTPFIDYDSIMDKCPPMPKFALSPGDVVGLQRAYGRKGTGTLIAYNGLCADISGGSSASGTPIIAFPCRDQTNDLWFRNSTTQRFQANLTPSTARCLNVNGGVVSGSSPTSVVSSTCGSAAAQQFPLANVEWHGMGSMCVTAVSGNPGGIVLNNCDGTNAQKWTFLDGVVGNGLTFNQIKSTSTGLCVSTQTSTGALGEVLVLAACDSAQAKQQFTYPGRGVIAFGNWCMNVSGGVTEPGHQIGLWNGCNAVPALINEAFSLSGNIKTVALPNGHGQNLVQCLDGSNPNQVTVSTCQPVTTDPQFPNNQIWEYYL